MDNQSIVVHGRDLKFEIMNIDIFAIDYYYENPRINYIVSRYPPDQVTTDLIESALIELDSTKDLRQDIEANGGLTDEIIVLDQRVIEGNTRLCCYRRIYKKTKDERWRYIRAKVILEPVSLKEIFSLLSNYHIKGKKPWNPYEKAACMYKMKEQGYKIEDIARETNSIKPKIEAILNAYNAMRDKYLSRPEIKNIPPMESHEELRKYSYFEAFYSDKELVKRVENTPNFLDEFVGWVAESRLPNAQDVRNLNSILSNKKAKKHFCEDDTEECYKEAIEVLNWQRPDKIDGFYKKITRFREYIDDASSQKIKIEIQENPQRKYIISHCLKVFQKFCNEIGLNK